MRRSASLHRLRRALLQWAGVVAVALSLLAMHQLSVNHTAAAPIASKVVPAAVADGHRLAHAHAAGDADAAHHTATEGPALAVGTTDAAPAADDCPGCIEHHVMALTCLAALALLAVAWLLRGPTHWTGWLPRGWTAAAQMTAHLRWRPPPLTLVELSISRT